MGTTAAHPYLPFFRNGAPVSRAFRGSSVPLWPNWFRQMDTIDDFLRHALGADRGHEGEWGFSEGAVTWQGCGVTKSCARLAAANFP